MMSVLQRALPFILTLLVGVAVGSAFKRGGNETAPADATTQSCMMRKRQVMLMPPPPPPPVPSFDNELFAEKDVTREAIKHQPGARYTSAAIKHQPGARYTSAARRNNVTGTVRLRVTLAADGTVQDILPLTFLPHGLTEEAVAAARAIEFTPATKDGKPVSQYETVEYNFNIY